jgi:hypothetical protein
MALNDPTRIPRRFARAPLAEVSAYTGPKGEFVASTDTDDLFYQDGVTPGGRQVAFQDGLGQFLDVATYAPPGSTTPKTIVQVLNDQPPSVAWYGAKGNNVDDDTAAIQKALDSNRAVSFPPGLFKLSAPLRAQPRAVLLGHRWEATRLERHGVWAGPTVQVGQNLAGQGSYAFHIKNILFNQNHPGFVQGTSTTMQDRLSSGQAHVAVFGGTNGVIEDCWFEHGVYGIDARGCTLLTIQRNFFRGSWDDANPNICETEASIRIANDPVHGYAAMNRLIGNYIAGGPLVNRTYTIGNVTYEMQRDGGSKFGVLVFGAERLEIKGGYIGGQNQYGVAFMPNGTICTNIDIEGIFFDGSIQGSIVFSASAPGAMTNIIQIHKNRFNGQMDAPRILEVVNNGGAHTAAALDFSNNIGNAHPKTPLVLFGLSGGRFTDNQIFGYHARGGGNGSPDFAAGAYVGQISRQVHFSDNTWGGGINDMGDANNCQWGVVFAGAGFGSTNNEKGILGLVGGAVVSGG